MKITTTTVTRKQLDSIFSVMNKVIGGNTIEENNADGAEQLIANRKYVLSQIIEMYCGWKDRLDCLPDLIQIGGYDPIYIRMIQTDMWGKIY